MLNSFFELLTHLASQIGKVVLSPVREMPGWLSLTILSAASGVVMLALFKYTSPQRAIERVRRSMSAHFLALSLYKDDIGVSLKQQGGILLGALKLFVYALIPMAIMTVPMLLILGQLSLWYQARPLLPGEEAVVTMKMRTEEANPPQLKKSEAVESVVGPVTIPSQQEFCWNIRATTPGESELVFQVDGADYTKDLSIGDNYLPVSVMRPEPNFLEVLLHPYERPFPTSAPVESISIQYPDRESWISGTHSWLIYWFVVSMVFAFIAKPLLHVHL